MSERELLTGFLDWYRAVVENKVVDLSLAKAFPNSSVVGIPATSI